MILNFVVQIIILTTNLQDKHTVYISGKFLFNLPDIFFNKLFNDAKLSKISAQAAIKLGRIYSFRINVYSSHLQTYI